MRPSPVPGNPSGMPTVRLQDSSQTQGDIERLVFLGNALARNATAVEASVTGINHNRPPSLAAGERGERHETRTGRERNKTVKIN